MNLYPERGGQTEARVRSKPTVSGHQALCFGYFHLGQQMKVTRPPGRDPARVESEVPSEALRDLPRRGQHPAHALEKRMPIAIVHIVHVE